MLYVEKTSSASPDGMFALRAAQQPVLKQTQQGKTDRFFHFTEPSFYTYPKLKIPTV